MVRVLRQLSPIAFDVPRGVVDSHCHIFNPEQFAYSRSRKYTPGSATVDDLARFHTAVQVERTVLIQPSVYGTDNTCLLHALSRLGDRARGVAVIDETFSGQQLDDLIAAGVVGVRLNLEVGKARDVESAVARLARTVETLKGKPFIVQLYAALPVLVALAPYILDQPHSVVIDHFGLARAEDGAVPNGIDTLYELMQSKKVFVKLSGPYQISHRKPEYEDTALIGAALVDAAPDQVIWGSDWPHTGGSERPVNASPSDIEPFRDEDEGRNFNLIQRWAAQSEARYKLLVENPEKVFGFAPSEDDLNRGYL